MYDEQHDEVLKRTLVDIMAAYEEDEVSPIRGHPHKRYDEARDIAAGHPDVAQRTEIRKLCYSPSLPRTIGTIWRLGPPFSTSRFLNLVFLRDLQRIHSGVAIPHRSSRFRSLTFFFQFFCKLFEHSLRDLDLLLVPLKRPFKFGSFDDLMVEEHAMKTFLRFGASDVKQAKYLEATGVSWQSVYDQIEDALGALKVEAPHTRRHQLVENGMMDIFAQAYDVHAQPPTVETTDLRDIASTAYTRRMDAYIEDVVTKVSNALQLKAEHQEAGSWREQLASKLRFLGSRRGGFPARPFFCLNYLLHIHREFSRTPDAIKEVRIAPLFHPQCGSR